MKRHCLLFLIGLKEIKSQIQAKQFHRLSAPFRCSCWRGFDPSFQIFTERLSFFYSIDDLGLLFD